MMESGGANFGECAFASILPDRACSVQRVDEMRLIKDIDPLSFVGMPESIRIVERHITKLTRTASARAFAGVGANRIVASLAPIAGPSARIYAAERQNRDKADDVNLLFAPRTGLLEAVFVGPEIGRWRVAVLSALALRGMASHRGGVACLFGCGGQAAMLLDALEATVAPEMVYVVGRDIEGVHAFIHRHAKRLRSQLVATTDARPALMDSQVIVTATSAQKCLIDFNDCPLDVLILHIGDKGAVTSEVSRELYRTAVHLVTDAPAELAARFDGSILHAAERRREEVQSLGNLETRPSHGCRIYISLGLCGVEAVLARSLLCSLLQKA